MMKKHLTEWIIRNKRAYQIVEDEGLLDVARGFMHMGHELGFVPTIQDTKSLICDM